MHPASLESARNDRAAPDSMPVAKGGDAVKITLLSEESIRLEGPGGPLTIEAESAEEIYSPFHMLASGLAVCTYSILVSWATNARMQADDLAIEVGWSFA